jgi:hypothetical protein
MIFQFDYIKANHLKSGNILKYSIIDFEQIMSHGQLRLDSSFGHMLFNYIDAKLRYSY